MKKIKKFLIVIGVIIGLILLDSIQALVFDNNPIIKTKEYYNGGDLNYKSKGILVDTYNCTNGKKDTQIKGFSYSCNYKGGNYTLVDKTKNKLNFACAEVLEEFYEDDNYTYYYNCAKSKYVIVKYESGYEETVKNALKYGTITIDDLDKYDIEYSKQEKEKISKEDVISTEGLLFSISYTKSECIPVQLNVYDNGKYILDTSYEACRSNENCNSMLKYTESVKGNYDYDVMQIIQNSTIADNLSFTNETRPEYELYTGNGEKVYMLVTDSNNQYLNEFLKQIDVNLKTCAEPDYK